MTRRGPHPASDDPPDILDLLEWGSFQEWTRFYLRLKSDTDLAKRTWDRLARLSSERDPELEGRQWFRFWIGLLGGETDALRAPIRRNGSCRKTRGGKRILPAWDLFLSLACRRRGGPLDPREPPPTALARRFPRVATDELDAIGTHTIPAESLGGSLNGLETTILDWNRVDDLELAARIPASRPAIPMPTFGEILRLKAGLILRRNLAMDYEEFARLADRLGRAGMWKSLRSIDARHPQRNRANVLQQFIVQLAHPEPWDCEVAPETADSCRSLAYWIFQEQVRRAELSISRQVWERVQDYPFGFAFLGRGLLMGNRSSAVRSALSRLVAAGHLMRFPPGAYCRPTYVEFLGRHVPPSAHKIARTLATDEGATLQINPAEAALGFGLTQGVPVQSLYLTTGRGVRIRYGKGSLTLRHEEDPWFILAGRPAGHALIALLWLGERHPDAVDQYALDRIKAKLPKEEFDAFLKASPRFPSWLQEQIRRWQSGYFYEHLHWHERSPN